MLWDATSCYTAAPLSLSLSLSLSLIARGVDVGTQDMKEVAKGALEAAASSLMVAERNVGSMSATAMMDKAKRAKGVGGAGGEWSPATQQVANRNAN